MNDFLDNNDLKKKRLKIENKLIMYCNYDLIRQSIPYIQKGEKMKQQKKNHYDTRTEYINTEIFVLIFDFDFFLSLPINHEQVSSYVFHNLLFQMYILL